MNKKIVIVIGVFLVLIMSFFSFSYLNKNEKTFDVNAVLLKHTLKKGDSFAKSVKIVNTLSKRQDFKIASDSIFFLIGERKFSLDSGETKNLEINFSTLDLEPGVYVGKIEIIGSSSLTIPVILEIETKDVLFDNILNAPPEHFEVYRGGKLVIDNKIFNLENIGQKNIELDYVLYDVGGNEIFLEKENLAVENQILTTKVIPIPENINTGYYVLATIVRYKDSIGTSSYSFSINNKKIDLGDYYFWIVVVLLFFVLLFVLYYYKKRDDIFIELEGEHKRDLKKAIESIQKEKNKIGKLNITNKRKKLREISKIRKRVVKKVNEIYKERKKILHELKKNKKTNEMEKMLEEWKSEGYNTGEFLAIGKNTKKKVSEKEINSLRKQGYKLG